MHEIAAPDRDVLLLGAFVEFVVGDAFAVLHPFHAAEARDVEQHAAPDHLVLGMLDAEHVQPARVDQLGVVAVIGLVLVEHVAERVPVGGALHAQHERVVGVADLVPVLLAGDGVGAGREHLVDRIEAAAEQAVLRALAVERNAEREHLAGADQARRLDDVLGRDVVERAALVVLAPAAPVRELLRSLGDGGCADLDVHAMFVSVLVCRNRAPGLCGEQYCAGLRCFSKRWQRCGFDRAREACAGSQATREARSINENQAGRIFMKCNLIAAVGSLSRHSSGVAGSARPDIVDEWANVKAPAAPALKEVTVDPKTTALLMLDFMKQNCGQRPRCSRPSGDEEAAGRGARRQGAGRLFASSPTRRSADVLKDVAPQPASRTCCPGPKNSCNTELEKILKDKGITTVIVAGTAANGAVLSYGGGRGVPRHERDRAGRWHVVGRCLRRFDHGLHASPMRRGCRRRRR